MNGNKGEHEQIEMNLLNQYFTDFVSSFRQLQGRKKIPGPRLSPDALDFMPI
jgi:hypothetical protein